MFGRRWMRALLAGAVASGAAGALMAGGALDRAETGLLDARFDVRGSQGPPADVVVVGIDEDSIAQLGRWPFPRSLHARAIRALERAGARAIAYDVQFSQRSRPREDRALLAAASDPRVVLGTVDFAPGGQPAVIGGAAGLRARGGRVGWADFPADRDGAFRRLQPRVYGVPQLSVLAAGGDPGGPTRPIDFAGPPGTVRAIPFADVVTGRFERGAVRGRVAVVGATATSLQDLHPTAMGGLMAGPEVHANAIQTVLDGFPLRAAPTVVAVLVVLAAGLLAPLATLPGSPARAVAQALGAGVLGAAALSGGAQLAFDAGRIVPVAGPLVALALGTAGAVALTYGVEVRARRRTRLAFERFVPPEVVDEILRRDGAGPRLESRRLEATVLFCDLRGFTGLAERLEAERVITVLNRYLELVSGAVFDQGGTVVSYQGDGVLAVFGAPLERPGHAAAALAAARHILDVALPAFNAWLLEEGLADAPLRAGIGLNTGTVMSGSVGGTRRLEYAAVGDATNVAARLQALSRDAPTPLFVAQSTRVALGEAGTALRRFGELELPGRRERVTVYTAD